MARGSEAIGMAEKGECLETLGLSKVGEGRGVGVEPARMAKCKSLFMTETPEGGVPLHHRAPQEVNYSRVSSILLL